MIFSSKFDRCKTNPLVYIKFWKQACLPSLLFGSELFTLTLSLLLKLELCQPWFLQNIFYVPSFAHSTLILKVSGLKSVESEMDVKRLLFFGRLITEQLLSKIYLEAGLKVILTLIYLPPVFCRIFVRLYENTVTLAISDGGLKLRVLPVYSWWKATVRRKVCENQNEAWSDFCLEQPNLKEAYDCLNNAPTLPFLVFSRSLPDLVRRLHVQVRIMGNFGLNGGIPWLTNTEGATCFVCKQDVETVNHFLLECPGFKESLDSVWDKLKNQSKTPEPC